LCIGLWGATDAAIYRNAVLKRFQAALLFALMFAKVSPLVWSILHGQMLHAGYTAKKRTAASLISFPLPVQL
jgi:hypothetical protein